MMVNDRDILKARSLSISNYIIVFIRIDKILDGFKLKINLKTDPYLYIYTNKYYFQRCK